MAIKKSELYSSLWKSCDELRGGMDASQYKDYVLVLLFVKYVSDKYADQPDAPIDVLKGGRFADMVALKGDKEIGDKINKIISRLAEANDLKGVIDVADFNDEDRLGKGNEMRDRLSNLVAIFENPALDFSRNRAEGDDLLGDAYEYLMRHFATESGKSKGQFYTPAEVSIVMSKVIGISKATSRTMTLHDPTCGSGSLLLKAADESPHGVTIYGQEMDNATAALARMNMILHNNAAAEIWKDNTLAHPHWTEKGRLKQFDFVVANVPFSSKAWSSGFKPDEDEYRRFEDGVPPQKNGDYAFLLHILAALKSTGKGAVILPHGVLFRGNAEGEIRRKLIRRGYIKGIIGLPPNLFFGTGIPACILVLDKENAAARTGIFMLDASKGFVKDGNKNRLRHQDIHRIVDVFNRQIEVAKYSRMVPLAEISDPKNDYNLNIPRYIDSTGLEDLQDIEAHLRGGIPDRDVDALQRYWQVCPALKACLFSPLRPGYSQLNVDVARIKRTIFEHPEFVAYMQTVHDLFARWAVRNGSRLKAIQPGDHPKALITALSEDVLQIFAAAPLIDPYDVYQGLMSYWAGTMQDDAYILVADGWQAGSRLRLIDEERKEEPDLKIGKLKYKADLIPPALIVARYFAAEQRAIEALQAEQESIARQMEELEEEHGGEDGLLADARNDKDKLTRASVMARLAEINFDAGAVDECQVLQAYLALLDQDAEAGRRVKEAQKALDAKVVAKYAKLSADEVKGLVVDDKWLSALAAGVQSELDRVSQVLTGRVKQLAERYDVPVSPLTVNVDALSAKVDAHLKNMGFVWN